MKTKPLYAAYAATIITAALSLSSFAAAQTDQAQSAPSTSPSTSKPAPAGSPTTSEQTDGKAVGDIDSFFKEGVSQTKKAQKNGNANCVPKPPLEKSTEPVS